MSITENIRNIGISAHIDSGKTTLTERILYYTGKIHKIEEVKGKSGVGATMDFMDLEREKGITIQSAATYANWGDTEINIIDTPGHVDFTIEVERALRVLDGAILVLCSVSGVQSQSITVDRQMKRYKVPRICFVNKMDRAGANPFRGVQQLRDKLGHNAHLITIPIGAEDNFAGTIDLVEMQALYFDGDNGETVRREAIPSEYLDQAKEYRDKLVEAMADFDNDLAEKFLDGGDVSPSELKKVIRKATLTLNFTPVMVGSAYKNKGVQPLLDAVGFYLPNPSEVENKALDQNDNEKEIILTSDSKKPLVMLAFKLEDGRYGQLTYMRIYQGTVKKGDWIYNINNRKEKVKVPRIVRMHASDMHDIEQAQSGDIVAMFGVECASGNTFCSEDIAVTMTSMFIPSAVMELAVSPKDKSNQGNFSKGINRFTKEDPTLRVYRDEESGETRMAGMGELHLEIYIERMKREYKTEVIVGKPQVAYRETITKASPFDYTHKKQSGGSGQYAKTVGIFEPLPPDAVQTFEFVDEVVGGSIPREYIPAVEKGFMEQVKKGTLIGFPVVGLRARLTDGAYHDVDSSEMAFRICAMAAFRECYPQCAPAILEPIMKLECRAPEEFQGSVTGLINQRRGAIMGTGSEDKYCVIESEVPLSEMFGFATTIRSATQGKGEFSMEFARYTIVPRQIQDKLVQEYQEKLAKERK